MTIALTDDLDDSPPGARMAHVRLAVIVIAWGAAAAAGFGVLWQESSIAGAVGEAPLLWPTESSIALASDRATLVMFAHPQCACTRASLTELGRIMATAEDRIVAHVVFLRPTEAPSGWDDSSAWGRAEQIPGATARWDDGGVEATRFGALTSGQVVVYGTDGALLFHGGITVARGHEGENAAEAQLVLAVERSVSAAKPTSVYGCGLEDDDSITAAER